MCSSLITGASLIGAAMTGGGLKEDGEGILGNLMAHCGTGWKCSRRRPCTGAGKAGGSSLNSFSLVLSDAWIFRWAGSWRGLKLTCLFGTEYQFPLSSSALFDWFPDIVVLTSCTLGQSEAVCWADGDGGSLSNFMPTTCAAGTLCGGSLERFNTDAHWLGSAVARSPWEGGINLPFSLKSLSGAWTKSGCTSWRKKKKFYSSIVYINTINIKLSTVVHMTSDTVRMSCITAWCVLQCHYNIQYSEKMLFALSK